MTFFRLPASRSRARCTGRPFRLAAAGTVVAAALAPAAQANNLQTLDAHAQSPGHVLLSPPGDAAGSALIAWTTDPSVADKAPVPQVCLLVRGQTCAAPFSLPLPGAAPGDLVDAGDGVEAVFPVAGSGSTVWVFGPRESHGDVLRWTSHDGGATFGAASVIGGADSNGLIDPQDAVTVGATTMLGLAGSASAGVSAFPSAAVTTGASDVFADAGPDVQTSSLALDQAGNPVIAYFNQGQNDEAGDSTVRFYRYASADHSVAALGDRANWSGPQPLSTGYEPLLTGGAAGLFAVTKDGDGVSRPTVLNVRKDSATGFGTPIATLSTDADDELFDGGAATQSPAGHLAVLWPATRSGDSLRVMRMYASDDGGGSFQQSDVAAIGADYRADRNAQAALGDDGHGVVTFRDGDVLQLADLSPITPFTAPQPTPPVPAPPVTAGPAPRPVLVFDPARGPFTVTTVRVGDDIITLQTPKGCVRSGRIVARLSVKSRKRKGHVVVKVGKVQFRYDGRLIRTITHRPFTARFTVTVTPGSVHTISARAFLRNHQHRRITRTLRNRFTACS